MAEEKKQQAEILEETIDDNQAEQTVQAESTDAAADDNTAADVDKVLAAVAEKNRQLEENEVRYKRLQADFENFKRRTRQEKAEIGTVVKGELILALLPVIDNFERAFEAEAVDAKAVMEGVTMIYKQLISTLEQAGAAHIEAVGQQFDPNFHEAVMRVEDADKEDGIIVDELQKGYTVSGRVIRPSMVRVVNNG